ncbi:hypothetical protein CAOG_06944 [Capsaspora owczarzaki ATCC 30864]|uniref:Uncharacterized protein n=1 Tax=Capsaspora owczarzaki (strain ATCC 30864) TaxID=595528 RepID=A0A0D2X4U2_CAPO3|nr:hypothetical protein CAOG_06944 [Capsaspora owczarzaki ATCC 30864]KJE96654.1 hypothetical protein CAOG_006944 [Capsaspora owczarzaki ATCC 30864]|eukprot:XP_004343668.1 hypothetical protein CAOG_06944 [Capsaspora owczarzaki ATCC 30864]
MTITARVLFCLAGLLCLLGLAQGASQPLVLESGYVRTDLSWNSRLFVTQAQKTNGMPLFTYGQIFDWPLAADTLEQYDFTTGAWSSTLIPGGARWGACTGKFGNKHFFYGGERMNSNWYIEMDDSLRVYDEDTGLWSNPVFSLGFNISRAACASADGILYMASGISELDTNLLPDLYVINLETLTWRNVSLPHAHVQGAAAVVAGKLVVAGGTSNALGDSSPMVDVLDLATETWTSKLMPLSTNNMTGGYLNLLAQVYGDKVFLGCGAHATGPLGMELFVYDGATDSVSVIHLDHLRSYCSFVIVEDRYLVLYGGSNHDMSATETTMAAVDLETYEVTTIQNPGGRSSSAAPALATWTNPANGSTSVLVLQGQVENAMSPVVEVLQFAPYVTSVTGISHIHGGRAGGLVVSLKGNRLFGPNYDSASTLTVKLNGVPAEVLSFSITHIDFKTAACTTSSCVGLGNIEVRADGRLVRFRSLETSSVPVQLVEPLLGQLPWYYSDVDGDSLSFDHSGALAEGSTVGNLASDGFFALHLASLLPASWSSLVGTATWTIYGHDGGAALYDSLSNGDRDATKPIPSGGAAVLSQWHGIVHLEATPATSDTTHYVLFSVVVPSDPDNVFHGAVSIRQYSQASCPDLQRLGPGATPSTPYDTDFAVSYDVATDTFHFELALPYISDGYSFVADLAEFNPHTSDAGSIRSQTKCAHRRVTAGNGVPYELLFTSQPTADFGGSEFPALNNDAWFYPYESAATAADGFSGSWTLSASSCSRIQLSATFTSSELSSCREADGETQALSVGHEASDDIAGASDLVYSGVIHVVYFRPVDRHNPESSLFTTSTARYPFSFRFASDLSGVHGDLSTQQTFSVGTESNTLDEAGLLSVRLHTTYNPTAALSSTMANRYVVVSNPVSAVFAGSSATITCTEDESARGGLACSNSSVTSEACDQFFDCTSTGVWNGTTDNGMYRFVFENELAREVMADISLNHNIVRRATVDGAAVGDFSLVVRTFASAEAFNEGSNDVGAFEAGDFVYLRTDVVVPINGSFRNLEMDYVAVYVCAPPPFFVISLEEGHHGCLDTAISSLYRGLVYGSAPAGAPLAQLSMSAAHPEVLAPSGGAAASLTGSLGLRFNASPLAASATTWYVHVIGSVSSVIGHGGSSQQRRNVQFIASGSDKTHRKAAPGFRAMSNTLQVRAQNDASVAQLTVDRQFGAGQLRESSAQYMYSTMAIVSVSSAFIVLVMVLGVQSIAFRLRRVESPKQHTLVSDV